MIGIYKITSPSSRVYIGQSTDLEKRRWKYSISDCKGQVRLYASLVKYSFSKHIFEVVEECEASQLNVRERHWQDFYDVISEGGLNCKLTGTDDLRVVHSEETRRKISEGNTGNVHSEETKLKRVKSREWYSHSEETVRRISEGNKGRKLSEEHKSALRGPRGPQKNPRKNKLE